jgi:hypothetical protein
MKQQIANYLNNQDNTATIILSVLFILIILNWIIDEDHNEEIL